VSTERKASKLSAKGAALAKLGKASVSDSAFDLWIGRSVLIRTVTMFAAGVLVRVYDQELLLESASWVADTGRWTQALKSGDFGEVEMSDTEEFVIIGRGGIIDANVIPIHPSAQKPRQ
jgi:hypothetical protein